PKTRINSANPVRENSLQTRRGTYDKGREPTKPPRFQVLRPQPRRAQNLCMCRGKCIEYAALIVAIATKLINLQQNIGKEDTCLQYVLKKTNPLTSLCVASSAPARKQASWRKSAVASSTKSPPGRASARQRPP